MSIRFKFRSSVNYDTVEIDGRSSIMVRELRLKIIRHKNLNICQDFDLVFSDADSGQEYNDENFQIPSGSSVIIKRVPARAASPVVPIDAAGSFGVEGFDPINPAGDQMDKFDDFGTDLYPVPVAIPFSDLEFDKNIHGSVKKANVTGLRNKGNVADNQRAEGQMKLEKLLNANPAAMQNVGLPSELKCFLCNAYFKEAVMIPCCQHSFCDKCIRQVLVEKARCPKCFSDRCNEKDLLPNLSLRQAIDHFLESQLLMAASENAFNKYAPDGESGIQDKDVSCAVTVIQREPELPHSPSATGKGSNIIMPESFYDSRMRRNAACGPSDYNVNHLAAGRESSAPKMQKDENLLFNLPQNNVRDEADSTHNRKRGLWVDTGGRDRSFLATGRQIKGNRTCYMCGSPDHLIRDCPVSSGPHPMFQTGPGIFRGGIAGYASSYWNSSAYPPLRPFPNMYSNPAMMSFNAPVVPITTYGVPPYAPNMYGGLPTGGIMRTGVLVPPQGNRAEQHPDRSDVELQYAEKKRKLSSEYLGRGQNYDVEDDFHERNPYYEPERSHEYRVHKEREASGSRSEDSFERRSRKKNHLGQHGDSDTYSRSSVSGRDQKQYPSERSGPDLERMERSKHHHGSSRRLHEKREQSRSNSSRGHHHQSSKEAVIRLSVDSDVRGSHKKHGQYIESRLEPSSPGDKRRQQKDRDLDLEFRHPRHNSKRKNKHPYDDRWLMVSGSDEDRRDDYRRRKREKVH